MMKNPRKTESSATLPLLLLHTLLKNPLPDLKPDLSFSSSSFSSLESDVGISTCSLSCLADLPHVLSSPSQ